MPIQHMIGKPGSPKVISPEDRPAIERILKVCARPKWDGGPYTVKLVNDHDDPKRAHNYDIIYNEPVAQ